MKPRRFWPLATIILLPVLVLAGVAAYFLVEQRRTVGAEAKATAESMAASTAMLWEQSSQSPPRGTEVRLYDDPPVPGSASAAAEKLEQALATQNMEALRDLRDAPEPQGHTASGLPVRVLAGWALYQAQPGNLTSSPLYPLALNAEPSVISPRILSVLKGEYGWIEEAWAGTEAARFELQAALADGWSPLPAPVENASGRELVDDSLKNNPSVALRRAGNLPRGSVADTAPEGGRGLVRIMGWPDGRTAVVLDDREPQRVAERVQAEHRRAGIDWAYIQIREGNPLPGTVPRVRLAEKIRPEFSVFVFLTSASALYAGYWRLVWWYSGIIGGALFTALLGLWLVRRTLEKERRLGKLKSQFVSSVSHELRAPVGSMRLMAEGLASGRVQGETAKQFHQLMAGEGARLSSLIENVLDFARIEEGRKAYHFAETDAAALIQDAVALMRPQAEAKGLQIDMELEPLPFVPQVDAGAVQQALINLLDNAIKFSPPNAGAIQVALRADPSGKSWSLTVKDHGPGIPGEEHTRIFERFYRLGNELRRETTGTGIGLAIVKHIVEGHGGQVTVESRPGEGSRFTVVFPENQ